MGNAYRTFYWAVEGIDGTGKTTFIQKLSEALVEIGVVLKSIREPGGPPVCQIIRSLVQENKMCSIAQLFLFCASRAIQIDDIVRPQLAQGFSILSDRSFYSSIAYQGAGGGEDEETVRYFCEKATGGTVPDLVILLDLDADTALERCGIRGEKKTVFEAENSGYMEKIRRKFLQMSREQPEKWVVVDASPSEDEVFSQAWKALQPVLEGLKK